MHREGPPLRVGGPPGSRDQLLSASSSPNKKDKDERYLPVPVVQKKCELRHSPGRDFDSYSSKAAARVRFTQFGGAP
jgi:hypothetical protein